MGELRADKEGAGRVEASSVLRFYLSGGSAGTVSHSRLIWRVTECVKIHVHRGMAAVSSLSYQQVLIVGSVAQAICRAGYLERAPVDKR